MSQASQPVVAIALDALSHPILESWMNDGTLPTLARLRQQGAYGRLHNPELLLYENGWLSFLQGKTCQISGQWGIQKLDAQRYAFTENPGFGLDSEPPFYAQPPYPRTAVFDLPLTPLAGHVNGIQVLGWGLEANQSLRVSSPPGLLDEIRAKYGEFPLFEGKRTRQISAADSILAFRNPSLYDEATLAELREQLIESIHRRTRILADLLKQARWDLFLAAYAEGHVAGHLLWHTDLAHPLFQQGATRGWLRDIYIALDRALEELTANIPDEAALVIFAAHGMKPNNSDMPTSLFLPELLYRRQFGRAALADGGMHNPPPPSSRHYRAHWKDEVWRLATPQGLRDLVSPEQLQAESDPHDWNPVRWYAPLWPQMRAFALHSYSHGMVRLNVAGRDGKGMVAPGDYTAECAAVMNLIAGLRCARTGEAIARRVWRTRDDPLDENPLLPPADIMVEWADVVTDVVEEPSIGRIGPAPYFRSGGHGPTGFCIMRGPGIEAGSALPENMQVTELSAALMRWAEKTHALA